MTRKDYIALAAAFAVTRPYVAKRSTHEQRVAYEVWHHTRSQIMQVLAADNYNFNRSCFIDATEIPQ